MTQVGSTQHNTHSFVYFQRSDFVAKLNKNLLRSFEDVIHNMESKREQHVDARGLKSSMEGKRSFRGVFSHIT